MLKLSRTNRLAKLAEAIDALPLKDDAVAAEGRRVEAARRAAATELHRMCASFASNLNALLKIPEMNLDPPAFDPDAHPDRGETMFQLNVRGRIVLLCFESPAVEISTENFREPYILEGSIRCFNQERLERASVEENSMFYCDSRKRRGWRYFHQLTYATGPMDENYLIGLFKSLL